jgi:nicotinamidase-related amidase
MKSCLLLIDVQESFRHRPYFSERDLPAYLHAQNALIEACRAAGVPIVRIFHVDGPKEASNAFALESGHVRPLQGLAAVEADATFHKSRHSALIGSGLDVWLTQQGIGRLFVSGIRTEQCCETTTRHASDLGFEVDYVPDATLTFDMRHEDGSPLPAADIKARTVAVLKDRFARIRTVGQVADSLAVPA